MVIKSHYTGKEIDISKMEILEIQRVKNRIMTAFVEIEGVMFEFRKDMVTPTWIEFSPNGEDYIKIDVDFVSKVNMGIQLKKLLYPKNYNRGRKE